MDILISNNTTFFFGTHYSSAYRTSNDCTLQLTPSSGSVAEPNMLLFLIYNYFVITT